MTSHTVMTSVDTRVIRFATAHDLENLRACTANIEHAAQFDTQVDMFEADIAFHQGIYQAAHHERLLQACLGMRFQIALLLLNRQGIDSNYRSQLTREHWALFDAINSRDLGLATT